MRLPRSPTTRSRSRLALRPRLTRRPFQQGRRRPQPSWHRCALACAGCVGPNRSEPVASDRRPDRRLVAPWRVARLRERRRSDAPRRPVLALLLVGLELRARRRGEPAILGPPPRRRIAVRRTQRGPRVSQLLGVRAVMRTKVGESAASMVVRARGYRARYVSTAALSQTTSACPRRHRPRTRTSTCALRHRCSFRCRIVVPRCRAARRPSARLLGNGDPGKHKAGLETEPGKGAGDPRRHRWRKHPCAGE